MNQATTTLTPEEEQLAEMVAADAAVTIKLLMRYRDQWDAKARKSA